MDENKKMKISKEKLKQIIKEEIDDWVNPLDAVGKPGEKAVDMHNVAILHKKLVEFFKKKGRLPKEQELQLMIALSNRASDRSRATYGQSESDPHPHLDEK